MTARRWWAGWVALSSHREPPFVLAAVRVLISLAFLTDFLKIGRLGLVEALFSPQAAGGFPDVLSRDPVPELYRWFPQTPDTAHAAWLATVVAITCFGAGFLTPLAGVAWVLLSAQLAQVLPLGDRGIDMLCRDAVCILTVSACGRAWSVDAWIARALGRPFTPLQPAWPRHLLILQLAVMYFCAGIQKTALAWGPLGGFSALYLVLQDPAIARISFAWLARIYPLTQLASVATIVFEWTAGLLPLLYWFRFTRTRPGRLRAFFNTKRPLRAWLTIGVLLHLGIASTMQLGVFPWAMLSLYPAFFHPDEWAALRRRSAR